MRHIPDHPQQPPEDRPLFYCVTCDKEMERDEAVIAGDEESYTFCPSCFETFIKHCSEYTARYIWRNLRWQ